MTANIILTNGTQTVTLFTRRVDEMYDKKITTITPPRSSANYELGPVTPKLVDLLRVTHRFEIDGYLTASEGTFGSGDSSSTLAGKTADLRSIFKAGGTFTMTYDGTDYTVNSEKLSIKNEPQDGGANLELDVKLSVLEGADI